VDAPEMVLVGEARRSGGWLGDGRFGGRF
jgi:hypothetical protein